METQKVPYLVTHQVFYLAALILLVKRANGPVRFTMDELTEATRAVGLRIVTDAEKDSNGDLIFENGAPKFVEGAPFELSLEWIPQVHTLDEPSSNVLTFPVQ